MTRLTVIAGPTAVGKGTVVRYLLEQNPEILVSVSATTRQPRVGEEHGREYLFVTNEQFDEMIAKNELLEYAVVHQLNRYGTPRGPVDQAIRAGQQMILEIDIQGAQQVKDSMPEANLIFIAPPDLDELKRRLVGRGTEGPDEIAIRLETAGVEMKAQEWFDHVVINREVAQCAQEVLDLMKSS
jgi:guanylate kinase